MTIKGFGTKETDTIISDGNIEIVAGLGSLDQTLYPVKSVFIFGFIFLIVTFGISLSAVIVKNHNVLKYLYLSITISILLAAVLILSGTLILKSAINDISNVFEDSGVTL